MEAEHEMLACFARLRDCREALAEIASAEYISEPDKELARFAIKEIEENSKLIISSKLIMLADRLVMSAKLLQEKGRA